MKLRIKGNSIRLRLTKTEVETLSTTGYFEEHTSFGNRIFTYALKSAEDVAELAATYLEDTITVFMNAEICRQWNGNETISYKHIHALDNGQELFLLVEKDFVCLDETFEDQSDNYPNPNTNC